MKNNDAVLKKYLTEHECYNFKRNGFVYAHEIEDCKIIVTRLCDELAAKDEDLKKLFKYDPVYCNAILKGEIPDQEAANNDGRRTGFKFPNS